MSRSGYDVIDDQWAMICYRGAVASAIRGKRGQALLRDLLGALDAMPDKKLIANDFVRSDGGCCALGVLGLARGIDPDDLHSLDDDPAVVAKAFGISTALAAEIEYENDEGGPCRGSHGTETTEHRWTRMRAWVASKITME